jgi:hypothetical protein
MLKRNQKRWYVHMVLYSGKSGTFVSRLTKKAARSARYAWNVASASVRYEPLR